MESSRLPPFLPFLVVLLLLIANPLTVAARNHHFTLATGKAEKSERKTYIVHVQQPEGKVFATSADQATWYNSFLPTTTASSAEPRMLHTYHEVATGFAARLTEEELAAVSQMDGFLHATPDRLNSLMTTHTPSFLGLDQVGGVWNSTSSGRGVIIGLLDTGVTPSHPSFADTTGIPRPSSKTWKGFCEFTNKTTCNNKLIGARTFLTGFNAMRPGSTKTTMAPVDDSVHGTHTASTAGGAAVDEANVLGNAAGRATGIAPQAYIAMYKVCGVEGCVTSDILAGMDAAVSDGVHVLSISIGGSSRPFDLDGIAIGAYKAMEKGIFVSCAAGNNGPSPSTLSNEAPWILTVAASTMDRSIRTTVKLGNGKEYDGESVFQPKGFPPTQLPLVYAGAAPNPGSELCGDGSLDGLDVKGKIVLCERGGWIGRIDKGAHVLSAGGAGMILANVASDGFSTLADVHVLPASHIGYPDGEAVKAYINSTSTPTAAIVFKGTLLDISPAPTITSFSSRGPSLASPGILKPDITGPGASVLAAWPFPVSVNQTAGTTFNVISGTSMSTPHLSGVAALLKAVHPDWSPAAIKSAMMTTANPWDKNNIPIVDEQHLSASLFAMGAGHVSPADATDPGLVYDLGAHDYIPYLCGLGYTSSQIKVITGRSVDCSAITPITEAELNYPSISVTLGSGAQNITVGRTVKNVGVAKSAYTLALNPPEGTAISVAPVSLEFSELGQELPFVVKISAGGGVGGTTSGGSLQWTCGHYEVRIPISVIFE